jgi:AcrR family transcriptional regulator
MSTTTPRLLQPPMRADARRNYDRLLATARDVFAEQGPDASLDEIARRAGVGIGTLYRHFPTRLALQEAVVRDQNEVSRTQAVALIGEPSAGLALATWLRAELGRLAIYHGLGAAVINNVLDGAPSASCADLTAAAEALLRRAQQAREIRSDIDITTLLRLNSAIATATEQACDGGAQAERLLAIMFDGLRSPTHPTGA